MVIIPSSTEAFECSKTTCNELLIVSGIYKEDLCDCHIPLFTIYEPLKTLLPRLQPPMLS